MKALQDAAEVHANELKQKAKSWMTRGERMRPRNQNLSPRDAYKCLVHGQRRHFVRKAVEAGKAVPLGVMKDFPEVVKELKKNTGLFQSDLARDSDWENPSGFPRFIA
jgi:hypothetical protein